MPSDSLKQRIRRRETIVGLGIPISTEREQFEKLLNQNHCDFVFVDSQHSAFSENALVRYCDMADAFDMPVQFRIKHTRHAYLIGNCLDLGPSGVEVPQVETIETVDEAIFSFYYPPTGGRSYGGGARRCAAEYQDPFAYAEWWNSYGVLWMQIESVQAVTGSYALARTGVDCLSFGPSDLAFDMKSHPHPHLKTVDDCIVHVARAIQGTDTALSFRNGTPDTRSRYADMGVTVFLESPAS